MDKIQKIVLFALLIIFSPMTLAGFDQNQLTISLGMVSVSYAESPSNLKNEDTGGTGETTQTAASGSASVMPVVLTYEMFSNPNSSFFMRIMAPLLPSATGNYMAFAAGKNFYIYSIGSPGEFKNSEGLFTITPKWRFYVGGGGAAAYLIYYTKTAKKSDINAELFFHGGAIHNINRKWGINAEFGVGRGAGVNTTTTVIKMFLGATLLI